MKLMIPNKEIKYIYETMFKEWLDTKIQEISSPFMKALCRGDEVTARKILNEALAYTISYFDYHENYYHGFLAGMLREGRIKSNRESGNGRYDLAYIPLDFDDPGFVIECKIAEGEKKIDIIHLPYESYVWTPTPGKGDIWKKDINYFIICQQIYS